jgi:arylsulfatase A
MSHAFPTILIAATCLFNQTLAATERPNVIVIMADDVGYGDVGAYGADPEVLPTPNIDRLAHEGLRFTDGYCTHSTCTPSRYSLLTGRYAWRRADTGIGAINSTLKIDPDRTTIADVFKSAGYSTAVIGKWHLGLGAGDAPDWNGHIAPGPLELGFDYAFLLPNTNDRVPSVYVENHAVANLDPADPITVSVNPVPGSNPYSGFPLEDLIYTSSNDQHRNTVHNRIGRIGYFSGGQAARWRDEDMADDFVAKALSWIEANQDNPFFLFFASQDNHVPRLPHERFQGASALSWRGDAIVQLDWSVGQIMEKLRELELEENTLVVFCSDNGPVLNDGYDDNAVSANTATGHQPAGVYRGGKYSVYEGGTRTPFITWWPGRIPAGKVSSEMVSSLDLTASAAALTRQTRNSPDDYPDSMNLLEVLLGVDEARGREHLIQSNNRTTALGFRHGNWKIVNRNELYDLQADPSESNNLAGTHSDILNEMLVKRDALMAANATALSLSAEAGDREVLLTWPESSQPDVAGYVVYRATGPAGPYSMVTQDLPATIYPDTTVINGFRYHYFIRTRYTDDSLSPPSNVVSALPSEANGTALQAEDAVIHLGAVNNLGSGWNGTGYVDPEEGGYVEFSFTAPKGGTYQLRFRITGDAPGMAAEISVNGTVVAPALPCPDTGSWNTQWVEVSVDDVTLAQGVNTIRFRDNGENQPQIDQLELLAPTRAAYTEWAKSFGLRQGLEGDEDGDGMTNLAEFSFGGDPTDPADAGYPVRIFRTEDTEGDAHAFAYPRRAGPDADVLYCVEASTDLSPDSWEDIAADRIEVHPEGFGPGIDRIVVTLPPSNLSRVFLRIRTQLSTP